MSDFREQALKYHAEPKPGKISIEISKAAETVKDLALAYSPGVAEPVREIANNIDDVYKYTGKGNLVAVISNGTASLLGPVSKSYSYEMQGKGQIIGVKFALGALAERLSFKPADFIDQQLKAGQIFDMDTSRLLSELSAANSDQQRVAILQSCFKPFAIAPSAQGARVRQLVSLIKQQSDITKVELLSERSNLSVQAIQRCFRQYLGITPKWLIRKYRLHQALLLLEQHSVQIADLVESLGYTDQSHLIRDFKEFLGVTPTAYTRLP